VIVQVTRAGNVAGGEGLGVSHVDHDGTLFAQGLGLRWGDAFEFGHGPAPDGWAEASF
jgi:hypothetical protein